MTDYTDEPEFIFGETIDGLNALNLDSVELHKLVEQFKLVQGQSDDIDEFLQFLLAKGAIDQSAYRRANDVVTVRLGSVELNDLPTVATVYDLLGKLGEGGMGEIYAARDKHLDRRVALKSLRPDRANDRVVSRFVLEAQVSAKLQHPNIIPVYSFHGEVDNKLSFAMKLVSGADLQDLIDEARDRTVKGESMPKDFAIEDRIELFLKICDAIAYAHDKGVLHRDLKPANIMLGEFNEVYVMDWGLAKIRDAVPEDTDEDEIWQEQIDRKSSLDEGLHTRVGAVIGTPLFMAPEQARGETLDERADQFGLGVILFQLVTLRRMYSARNIKDLLVQVRTGDKAPVHHLNPDINIAPELAAIVEKATAHDASDRYASVAAFARDLRRFRDDKEVRALPDPLFRKVSRWMSNNKSLTLGAVLGVVVLASFVMIWSLREQNLAIRDAQFKTERFNEIAALTMERAMSLDAVGASVVLSAESLALGTSYLVRNGKEMPGDIYTTADYDSTDGSAPPDFGRSERYKMNVSFGHPVVQLAPGVKLEDVEATVRRLLPLVNRFRIDMVNSARLTEAPKDVAGFAKLMETQGLPIRWAYVSLETGVHFSFPGKGNYPKGYDARTRPWYRFGKSHKGLGGCGNPYLDSQGQGLILPCVARILSPEGEFLGVAGYELTFDYLLQGYMQPKAPVTHTYLVNSDTGHVLVGSDMKQEYSIGKLKGAMELPEFPEPIIANRIVAGRYGQVEVKGEDGVIRVYTMVNLPVRKAVYVEVAPLDAVLKWHE